MTRWCGLRAQKLIALRHICISQQMDFSPSFEIRLTVIYGIIVTRNLNAQILWLKYDSEMMMNLLQFEVNDKSTTEHSNTNKQFKIEWKLSPALRFCAHDPIIPIRKTTKIYQRIILMRRTTIWRRISILLFQFSMFSNALKLYTLQ